jgi:hypothetical protein
LLFLRFVQELIGLGEFLNTGSLKQWNAKRAIDIAVIGLPKIPHYTKTLGLLQEGHMG